MGLWDNDLIGHWSENSKTFPSSVSKDLYIVYFFELTAQTL